MNTSPTNVPAHDKDMARRFLTGLDPNANRFTFQFFDDRRSGRGRIIHGTLDEVWPKVMNQNTPQQGVGVFVTVNETDFKGRGTKNIKRARALFADADSKEQANRCLQIFTECGAHPSMEVNSGRGGHFYFLTDVPLNQFTALQESLAAKLGTDPAAKDLPRVMRLPGTLHLKDPANPRFVKLINLPAAAPVRSWNLSDLIAKLGLSAPNTGANSVQPSSCGNAAPAINGTKTVLPDWVIKDKPASVLANLPKESLAAGLEANLDEVRSAALRIPPSAIATEAEWMKFARGFAFEAQVMNPPHAEKLWSILDDASRRARGYDRDENRRRWERYMSEAFGHQNPITIHTVFHMALEHGWNWSPPIAPGQQSPVDWSPSSFSISLSKIPHRRWLYGTYLIRSELTVLASPGGAGKTALATGIAIEIATGTQILDEKIYAGREPKVLLINGEDSGNEIERRIQAFCRAHVNKVLVQRPTRLYVAGADDARVQQLSFLRTAERNISTIDKDGFRIFEDAFEQLRPDLVILDPLVAFCGGGNMNDNAVMSLVIRELKHLAIKFDCAILIVHHTRKGVNTGDAEAVSGAAAIVNLARRAIMPVPMTDDEAKKLFVLPSERFRFFKLVDAKSNLAPRSAGAPWYKLHSVDLQNDEPPLYPFGDNVQAVQRVTLPQQIVAVADDLKIENAILGLITQGKTIDGQIYPYSPATSGATNERSLLSDAMGAVRAATDPRQWDDGDLKATTVRTIERLKKDGTLIEREVRNVLPKPGRFRRGRCLTVNPARQAGPIPAAAPPSPEKSSVAAPQHGSTGDGGQLVNGLTND